MMRIPAYMNLKISTLPVAMPYLATTQKRRDRWHTYIEAIALRTAYVKTRRSIRLEGKSEYEQ